jgi:hypothetical protein
MAERYRLPGGVAAFNLDGTRLATAPFAQGGVITLHDSTSGRRTQTLMEKHPVSALAFAPDGKLLASAHEDAVRLWDLEEARILATFEALPDPRQQCYVRPG